MTYFHLATNLSESYLLPRIIPLAHPRRQTESGGEVTSHHGDDENSVQGESRSRIRAGGVHSRRCSPVCFAIAADQRIRNLKPELFTQSMTGGGLRQQNVEVAFRIAD